MTAPVDLHRAVEALSAGEVVAIPTDTVYGLAVDPAASGATAALFSLKARPVSSPLPVLVAGVDQAQDVVGPLAPAPRRLAEALWPGALTIVVARPVGLGWDVGGDGTSLGLRHPACPLAVELCRRVGPLATTSANRHGHPPLTTAGAVLAEFDAAIVVVDGGVCDGQPSTVIDARGDRPVCLRTGGVGFDAVLEVWAGKS